MVQRETFYLNFVDKITIIYLLLVATIIFIFKNNLPDYEYYIAAHFIFIIFLLIFYKISIDYNLILLRDWYPLIIVTFLYEETGYLNQIVFKGFWDSTIYKIEKIIFGGDPGLFLYNSFNCKIINEIMYLFYFSYYLIIPILGLLIYKKSRILFHKFLISLMITYYICYILYIFIPIAGPFEYEQIKIKGLIFEKIIHFFYKYGELPGSAMPSSHVAIALIVLIYSKISQNYPIIFSIIFIFLSISTMYLRYHYFLDVEAGIFTGIFCYFISQFFIEKNNILIK